MKNASVHHSPLLLEPLEPRIAPAVLVDASTVTFNDVDGDLVTVKFNQKLIPDLAAAEAIFKFDTPFTDAGNQQLRLIDLTGDPRFNGVNISITVAKGSPGDMQVNIGAIDASGLDLGKVNIQGDLGRILAGSEGLLSKSAVKSLDIVTLAAMGSTTQEPGSDTDSLIKGNVHKFLLKEHLFGSLTITGNVQKGEVRGSVDGASLPDVHRPGILSIEGHVKKLDIQGSIGGHSEGTGVVRILGGGGKITVFGSVIGGIGNDSGVLLVDGGFVTSLGIRTDVLGGDGDRSGNVVVVDSVRKMVVQGDIRLDSTHAGPGFQAGRVVLLSGAGSVQVGNIVGGGGDESGSLVANGDIPKLITNDVKGGNGDLSGRIQIEGDVKSAKVGNVTGGDGNSNGLIRVIGNVAKLGTGNLTGGEGDYSARISIEGDLKAGKVGDVTGDEGEFSGSINIAGATGKLETGNLIGNKGDSSGRLDLMGINTLKVGTSGGGIFGSEGDLSGRVFIGAGVDTFNIPGLIGAGLGDRSGTVTIVGDAGSMTVGTKGQTFDAISTTFFLKLPVGEESARIEVLGNVNNRLLLNGNIDGGDKPDSGAVRIEGNAKMIQVNGDLTGFTGLASGSISVGGSVSKVHIAGVLDGGDGIRSGAFQAGDVTSGKFGALNGALGGLSGSVEVAGASNITLGRVSGGLGLGSGGFFSFGDAKSVNTGNVEGGGGVLSGAIISTTGSMTVRIGGTLISGAGTSSAAVMAGQTLDLRVSSNALGLGSTLFIGGGNLNNSGPAATNIIIALDLFNAKILGGWLPPTPASVFLGGPETPTPFTGNGSINNIQVGYFMVSSEVGAGVTPGPGGFGLGSASIGGGSASINSFAVAKVLNGFPDLGIAANAISKIVVAGKSLPVNDGDNIDNVGGTFLINLV